MVIMDRMFLPGRLKQDILIRFIFFLCTIILSSGIISNYIFYTQRMWPLNERNGNLFSVTNSGMIIFVVLNIILIVFNTRINYKFRNLRIKSTVENPFILYLICLPLILMAMLGLTFLSANYVMNSTEIDKTMFCIVLTLEFIFIIILVLDISGFDDTGEEWILNYMNCLTISVTMVSIFVQFQYNFFMKETAVFGLSVDKFFGTRYFQKPTNDTSLFDLNGIRFTIHAKQDAIMTLIIVFLPYLIKPWKTNIKHMLKLNSIHESEPDPSNNARARFPSIPGSIILALYFICTLVLKLNEVANLSQPDISFWNALISIGLNLVPMPATILMIYEISAWKKKSGLRHNALSTRMIIIYLGMFGHFTSVLTNIILDIYMLVKTGNDTKETDKFRAIYITLNTESIFGTFLQTCLISLLVEKEPERLKKNSWNYFFCTPLIILVHNCSVTVHELLLVLHNMEKNNHEIRLALTGIVSFSKPLVMLYRWISTLILTSLVVKLSK